MMNPYFKDAYRILLNLVYPPTCAACHRELEDDQQTICQQCLETIDIIQPPVCLTCGAPLAYRNDDNHRCRLFDGVLHFDEIRAVLYYQDERVRNFIFAYKFHFQERLAQTLGEYLIQGFEAFYSPHDFDGIVPVPLHKSRLKEREFNQATLLANELHKKTGIPVREDLVYRAIKTKPQTKLSNRARRQNLKNAFRSFHEKGADGLRLLVVDDVLTTGATVNEVCRILKKQGAKKRCVLTLARADLDAPIYFRFIKPIEEEPSHELPF